MLTFVISLKATIQYSFSFQNIRHIHTFPIILYSVSFFYLNTFLKKNAFYYFSLLITKNMIINLFSFISCFNFIWLQSQVRNMFMQLYLNIPFSVKFASAYQVANAFLVKDMLLKQPWSFAIFFSQSDFHLSHGNFK